MSAAHLAWHEAKNEDFGSFTAAWLNDRLAKPAWSLTSHLTTHFPSYDAAAHKPHREDYKEDRLPQINGKPSRPLCLGEKVEDGDWRENDRKQMVPVNGNQGTIMRSAHEFHITTRPLPAVPKVVAWDCAEDVPGPVCWLRPHFSKDCSMIVGISQLGMSLSVRDGSDLVLHELTWKELADHKSEYSLDRKTWHPCTKEAR